MEANTKMDNSTKTIYVAIPSMYDTELIDTVLNAFEAAAHPERIVVGVTLQDDSLRLKRLFKKKTAKWSSQIRFTFTRLRPTTAYKVLGVGKGRKAAYDLYKDEDYLLQCDSHTLFDPNWDSDLIALHQEAKKTLGRDKLILTAYAGWYEIHNSIRAASPYCKPRYPFYVERNRFSEFIPNWEDEELPDDFDSRKFLPCTKFNANFAFGDKEFANFTGLFEPAVFFEEEPFQSITLRQNGFALVFPNIPRSIVYHLYDGVNYHNRQGFRRTGYAYLTVLQRAESELRAYKNWRDVVRNPKFYDAIKDYETYSGTSLRYGTFREHTIPEDF